MFSEPSREDFIENSVSNGELPEAELIEKERKELVQKGLDGLPEKQQAVFVLRMYDDLNFKEMSEIMGTTESASRANFHQAMNKLKKIVSENQ